MKTTEKEKVKNPFVVNPLSTQTNKGAQGTSEKKETKKPNEKTNSTSESKGLSGTTQDNEKQKDPIADFFSNPLVWAGGLAALLYLLSKQDQPDKKPKLSIENAKLQRKVDNLRDEVEELKRQNRKVSKRVTEVEDIEPLEDNINRTQANSEDRLPIAYVD